MPRKRKNKNCAKDLRAFARAPLPDSLRHPFAGDAPLAKHRKTLAARAGEAKRAFLQVFRDPFPLADSARFHNCIGKPSCPSKHAEQMVCE